MLKRVMTLCTLEYWMVDMQLAEVNGNPSADACSKYIKRKICGRNRVLGWLIDSDQMVYVFIKLLLVNILIQQLNGILTQKSFVLNVN